MPPKVRNKESYNRQSLTAFFPRVEFLLHRQMFDFLTHVLFVLKRACLRHLEEPFSRMLT